MHDPRTGHMEIVYRILRYLKEHQEEGYGSRRTCT
jgi:hypothetical protein